MLRLTALSLALALAAVSASAQAPRVEYWPELQLHYKVDEKTKVIAVATTSREREADSAYEGEVGIAVDYRFVDFFSARVGYRHGFSLDGGDFAENRLFFEQTFRLKLPTAFQDLQVAFRTTEDLRWLNTGFSARLREEIRIQRDFQIGDFAFTPYVTAEIFFDTRFGQFNRYRLVAGVVFPLPHSLSIEPYFARQADLVRRRSNVNALGLVLAAVF